MIWQGEGQVLALIGDLAEGFFDGAFELRVFVSEVLIGVNIDLDIWFFTHVFERGSVDAIDASGWEANGGSIDQDSAVGVDDISRGWHADEFREAEGLHGCGEHFRVAEAGFGVHDDGRFGPELTGAGDLITISRDVAHVESSFENVDEDVGDVSAAVFANVNNDALFSLNVFPHFVVERAQVSAAHTGNMNIGDLASGKLFNVLASPLDAVFVDDSAKLSRAHCSEFDFTGTVH